MTESAVSVRLHRLKNQLKVHLTTEQWNNALDQVKDDFLSEAASYRPKHHWPEVEGAVAAVLAVGWSVLQPEPSMKAPTNGTLVTVAGPRNEIEGD